MTIARPTNRTQRGLTRRAVLAGAAATLAAPAVRASGGLRFSHVYGEIELKKPAERVVSLGYNTQDTLLALGTAPLGLRYWYGDYPYGVWPWAQPYLGDAEPVLMRGEVSIETVASLAPDLILGTGSGISEAEYAMLSQIAPVLMQPAEYTTYGSPWQVEVETIGRALGKDAMAADLVARVEWMFADARTRHPDWEGKTAVAAWHDGGQTGAFMGEDTRARFLSMLGFQPTEGLSRMPAIDGFYTNLSPEDLTPLEADLLVWISSAARAPDIANLAMRGTLKVQQEGREVFAGELLGGAMSFGSVLSLPFALEQFEPEFVLALDGDPATVVPSARDAGLAG